MKRKLLSLFMLLIVVTGHAAVRQQEASEVGYEAYGLPPRWAEERVDYLQREGRYGYRKPSLQPSVAASFEELGPVLSEQDKAEMNVRLRANGRYSYVGAPPPQEGERLDEVLSNLTIAAPQDGGQVKKDLSGDAHDEGWCNKLSEYLISYEELTSNIRKGDVPGVKACYEKLKACDEEFCFSTSQVKLAIDSAKSADRSSQNLEVCHYMEVILIDDLCRQIKMHTHPVVYNNHTYTRLIHLSWLYATYHKLYGLPKDRRYSIPDKFLLVKDTLDDVAQNLGRRRDFARIGMLMDVETIRVAVYLVLIDNATFEERRTAERAKGNSGCLRDIAGSLRDDYAAMQEIYNFFKAGDSIRNSCHPSLQIALDEKKIYRDGSGSRKVSQLPSPIARKQLLSPSSKAGAAFWSKCPLENYHSPEALDTLLDHLKRATPQGKKPILEQGDRSDQLIFTNDEDPWAGWPLPVDKLLALTMMSNNPEAFHVRYWKLRKETKPGCFRLAPSYIIFLYSLQQKFPTVDFSVLEKFIKNRYAAIVMSCIENAQKDAEYIFPWHTMNDIFLTMKSLNKYDENYKIALMRWIDRAFGQAQGAVKELVGSVRVALELLSDPLIELAEKGLYVIVSGLSPEKRQHINQRIQHIIKGSPTSQREQQAEKGGVPSASPAAPMQKNSLELAPEGGSKLSEKASSKKKKGRKKKGKRRKS